MSYITWNEVRALDLTHLYNTDYTYSHFEGELESIIQSESQVIIKCKWIRALLPSHHDDDGDPCYERVQWELWRKKEVSFSIDDKPWKTPDGRVIIECSLERYNTKTELSKSTEFVSLKPRT